MIEKTELRYYSKAHENPNLMGQFKREIYEGLSLERARFLRIPELIEARIVHAISTDFITLSERLDIPLPEIGLLQGWDQVGEEGLDAYDILASAIVSDTNPDGIVRFSPFYLKSYISHAMGIEQNIGFHLMPLEAVNGHEAYHLWQCRYQLEQTKRDYDVFQNGGLEEWKKTQTEIDAKEFERRWLERCYMPYD